MTPYKNVNQCINECQVLKDRAESFLENARSINEEFRIERDEGKGSKNYSLDDVPYGEEVCVIEEFVDEIDEYTGTDELMYWTSLYMEEGRNFHQGGCFSVRRLGRLNKSIFSNSRYLCLFRVINKSDIAYLESTLDFRINETNEKPEHSFDLIDLQKSEKLGRFKIKGNNIISA